MLPKICQNCDSEDIRIKIDTSNLPFVGWCNCQACGSRTRIDYPQHHKLRLRLLEKHMEKFHRQLTKIIDFDSPSECEQFLISILQKRYLSH